MKELVVISGKGGTGKTSRTASLAALAGHQVLVDCDVDAADLHLVIEPRIVERNEFRSGHRAVIRREKCLQCGKCRKICRFEAIMETGGCAVERGIERILVDGPPGLGCPVIASITGASLVLAVTEPTLSGRHDLGRVLDLARHFSLPAAVCVNKWDINPELTGHIEAEAVGRGATVIGRVRYDRAVTAAQVSGMTVVELENSAAAEDIRKGWKNLCRMMERP